MNPREITKQFGVPDALIGIPTPWWRRWLQRLTRRPGPGRTDRERMAAVAYGLEWLLMNAPDITPETRADALLWLRQELGEVGDPPEDDPVWDRFPA